MDEFANVSLPDDFDKILSVMRSRSVSVSIILQNLAQLKALFEKQDVYKRQAEVSVRATKTLKLIFTVSLRKKPLTLTFINLLRASRSSLHRL